MVTVWWRQKKPTGITPLTRSEFWSQTETHYRTLRNSRENCLHSIGPNTMTDLQVELDLCQDLAGQFISNLDRGAVGVLECSGVVV